MKIGGAPYFISRQEQTTWNTDCADDADARGYDIRENPRNPRHPCSIFAKFRKHTNFINFLNICANQVWSIDLHPQTDDKLRRENIRGKENANKTHFVVGRKVRQTIKELGGTMPEDLELPEKSIQEIEEKPKKRLLQGEHE